MSHEMSHVPPHELATSGCGVNSSRRMLSNIARQIRAERQEGHKQHEADHDGLFGVIDI